MHPGNFYDIAQADSNPRGPMAQRRTIAIPRPGRRSRPARRHVDRAGAAHVRGTVAAGAGNIAAAFGSRVLLGERLSRHLTPSLARRGAFCARTGWCRAYS
jgi:hypothetical protein